MLDGSLHKNIQLMMEFFKAPFLALYFCYYTLITFLIILWLLLVESDITMAAVSDITMAAVSGKFSHCYFFVIFLMCYVGIINYYFQKKKIPVKIKQGVNNCFKALILSVFTTVTSRLKSD